VHLGHSEREAARQEAAAVNAAARSRREAEQARKARERARIADKEEQRLYLESRSADVDASKEALDQPIAELERVLDATLSR